MNYSKNSLKLIAVLIICFLINLSSAFALNIKIDNIEVTKKMAMYY